MAGGREEERRRAEARRRLARTRYDAWIDRRKGMDKVESALLQGIRTGNHANTELLAYTEGFINIWHLRQDPPSLPRRLRISPGALPAAARWRPLPEGRQ